MNEIEGLIDERRHALRKSLAPLFAEDTNNTVEMLIGALRRRFGDPIRQEDRARFLEELAKLPRGSSARPKFDRVERADGYFRARFDDGNALYVSSKSFATEDEASAYATDFLVDLRGEIIRED